MLQMQSNGIFYYCCSVKLHNNKKLLLYASLSNLFRDD